MKTQAQQAFAEQDALSVELAEDIIARLNNLGYEGTGDSISSFLGDEHGVYQLVHGEDAFEIAILAPYAAAQPSRLLLRVSIDRSRVKLTECDVNETSEFQKKWNPTRRDPGKYFWGDKNAYERARDRVIAWVKEKAQSPEASHAPTPAL